jgi:hypothetical protein
MYRILRVLIYINIAQEDDQGPGCDEELTVFIVVTATLLACKLLM